MAEQLTQHDRKIFAIWKANSKPAGTLIGKPPRRRWPDFPTPYSPSTTLRKGKEEGQGLNREGAGEGTGEGTGEGVGQGVGEGVGQGLPQGSNRFVVGRPYNPTHDPDFRPSRRERLKGDESSSDDDDDDDDDEMEES
ncbi:hypothetical protein KC367_g9187 [Hortaea werneckii]|nr:hypothetical protein KC367_g9187 [Hortaea werneckii]